VRRWNDAFDDQSGLQNFGDVVPPSIASARLPAVAALLHPATASLVHLKEDLRPRAVTELKRLFYLQYKRDHPHQPPQHQPENNPAPAIVPNDVRARIDAIALQRDSAARAALAGAARSAQAAPDSTFVEFSAYFDAILDNSVVKLSWSEFWDESRRSKFPTMWKIARRVLAIPATSAPVESLFSTAGIIDDALRRSLSARALELLTLIKANAKLVVEAGWIDEWVRHGRPVAARVERDGDNNDDDDDDDDEDEEDAGGEDAPEEVEFDDNQNIFEFVDFV
jgi:hypothetical protein